MLKLKRVAHSLGLVEQTDKDCRRKDQLRGNNKASPDFISQGSKDIFVRIVRAGGKQEFYQHAIFASKLMEKNPGMCIARPEVFRSPHRSVLWPEERLVPGEKYILIPFRDVEKLKRKLSEEGETRESNGVVAQDLLNFETTRSPNNGHQKVRENGETKSPKGMGQEKIEAIKSSNLPPSGSIIEEDTKVSEIFNAKEDQSLDGGTVEESSSFSSAKEFYCNEKPSSTKYPKRKGIKGKKPFAPPLKVRSYRSFGWQPSLPTVQELSL